jgi:protease-4
MRPAAGALCLPLVLLESVMSEKKPGAIRRLFQGLWDALNFTRRLVFNLLFLLLLVIFVAALFGGGAALKDRTALVLAPRGELVEQFTADPSSRAFARMFGEEQPETQLRDVLRAIEAAAKDKRIDRIVIRPDALGNAGHAGLREVGRALLEFKKSGKQVVAYADYMEQKQYYLAAHADEVYLHPAGALLLEGLSRYRSYYREGLQDKLGVDVHLFRVGEYKSAAEPYILDGPSPESREADLFWLDDLWQRYLADIGALRKLDPATLQGDIDNFAERIKDTHGDLAALALRQKLVDKLTTQDEFRAIMIERGAADEEEHTFRQVALEDYLGFIDRETLPLDPRPQVAVVVAQGEIVDGDQPPGVVGGLSTAELVRDAREDEHVKAVVLRVDSPGGGVFPSEQIRREVQLTRDSGKPVIVSMGDVAASGGYWISMNADEIWADESTITGSIGIFGLFMTIPDTLAKIGVHVDGVATTRIAGAFDPTRPLDPQVGQVIQAVIDDGYRDFVSKVATARETTPEAIDAVARGRVWSGAQAKERGLVDQLGGLKDAIASAAAKASLDAGGFGIKYVEKEMSPFEKFVVDATRNAMLRSALAGIGPAKAFLPAQVGKDLSTTLRMLQDPRPIRAVAF